MRVVLVWVFWVQMRIRQREIINLPTVISVMIFFLRVPTIGATIVLLLVVCSCVV